MKIIIYPPKNSEAAITLSKKVAEIHADCVIEHITQLTCPLDQKRDLIKSIKHSIEEQRAP